MADTVSNANFQQLKEQMGYTNTLIDGLTPSEAVDKIGATNYGGVYTTPIKLQVGHGISIEYPDDDAAAASAAYIAAGGTLSLAGAAGSASSNAITVGNSVITVNAAGTASSASLLAVSLPTIAAAVAPLCGVAIGVKLYELNPQLWEKISRALLPFCYDDTELIPVAMDADGNTYINDDVITAMKSVLTGVTDDVITFPQYDQPSSEIVVESSVNLTQFVLWLADLFGYTIKDSALAAAKRYDNTYPNSWFWFNSATVPPGINNYPHMEIIGRHGLVGETIKPTYVNRSGHYITIEFSKQTKIISQVSWIYDTYASYTGVHLGYKISSPYMTGSTINTTFNAGVTKWNGVAYPDDAPTLNLLSDYSGTTKLYKSVTIPTVNPYLTVAEEIQSLTTNTDPDTIARDWNTSKPKDTLYPPDVATSAAAKQLADSFPVSDTAISAAINPALIDSIAITADPSIADAKDMGATPTVIVPITQQTGRSVLTVYNPTKTQIDQFGQWLWSSDIIDQIAKIFANPMDAVIGVHEIYTSPIVEGSDTIKAGYLDSGVPAALVSQRYKEFSCGSIVIEEYYQNYLDYSPYTQCYIYLPFIGIQQLSADDVIGNAVNVTYKVDCYTGCCIAVITVAKDGYNSAVYQFEGNCAVELPLTSGNFANLMLTAASTAAGVVTGLNTGSIPSAGASLWGGLTSGTKASVQYSGGFGSSFGAMGCKTPYIIVKRPVQKRAYNYSKSYGYPAHKSVTVGDCSGYLRVREVIAASSTATEDEKSEIISLLKSGVYVS